MKKKYAVALSLLTGCALGGTVIQTLHAQAKPHAFFVADISEMNNAAAFKAAAEKTGAIFDAAGGKRFVRTDNVISLHGDAPKRYAIVRFENMDAAKAWASRSDIKAVWQELDKASKERRFLVEGLN